MAGRPLTIALDEATRAQLEAAAAAAGLSLEDHIVEIVRESLSPRGVAEDMTAFEGPDDRTEEARRYQNEQAGIALAEYDRSGISYPLEEVLRDLRADLEARLASRA
jgi:plasmid stability protein